MSSVIENPQHSEPSTPQPAGKGPPRLMLEAVSVYYGDHTAIHNANLAVEPGEVMALVGPSGCGKTSLLNAINRMSVLVAGCRVSGRIRLDDLDTAVLDDRTLRRRVGMVFQKPNPFPLSVRENIAFPLREHGLRRRRQWMPVVETVLKEVGLWSEVAGRLDAPATALSGGQQQRLCIARALALKPDVLLFDEPCSALDPIAAKRVEDLIVNLKGRYTVLMVTHNLAQARRVADTVAVCWMDSGCGCVIETGPTHKVFDTPQHPVAAAYCSGEAG